MVVPRRDHLNEQPYSDRCENAIRPDDLRPSTSIPVATRLCRYALLVENPHAPKTMLTRRGQDYLSADDELTAHRVHVHADIDVRNKEPAGKLFELIALGK